MMRRKKINGDSVGPVFAYTFSNVTANGSISATFSTTSLQIITDRDNVSVRRGATASLRVKLNADPGRSLVVAAAKISGTPAISIQGVT